MHSVSCGSPAQTDTHAQSNPAGCSCCGSSLQLSSCTAASQVAAKSNPDLAGMGTGATTVNDTCLTRCGSAGRAVRYACSSAHGWAGRVVRRDCSSTHSWPGLGQCHLPACRRSPQFAPRLLPRRLLAQSPLLEELDVSGCERLSPNCLALAVHPGADCCPSWFCCCWVAGLKRH